MKGLKITGWILLLLIIIIIGAAVFLISNLNTIVKQAVESEGPKLTETSVLLDQVDLKLLNGRGELNEFVIGNPDGFNEENILEIDQFVLQFDPTSAFGDVVVVNEITLKGLVLTAEQKGLNTNVQALLDTLTSGSSGSSSEVDGEAGDPIDKKIILENLDFSDNVIRLVTEKWGSYDLKLPSFSLVDIGKQEGGLSPEELGIAVLEPLMKNAQKTIEQELKKISEEELKKLVKEKEAEIKAKIDETENQLKEKVQAEEEKLKKEEEKLKSKVKDALGEDAEEKVEALKGLLN